MDIPPLSGESRSLIATCFTREVPEIASGTVTIRALARIPGVRTKVAVSSDDPAIDPVRACVGPEAIRIRQIVAALQGELVPWSDSPERSIRRALAPLTIVHMELASEKQSARVVVARHPFADMSSTTRDLASTLTGWDIELLVDPAAA